MPWQIDPGPSYQPNAPGWYVVIPALAIAVASIASAEAFGAPTVAIPPISIQPAGIASLEAFGTAQISRTFATPSIASAEAFGTPTVNRGAVALTPGGIASAEAFGSATLSVGPVGITATGISSTEAVGTATVGRGAVNLAPTGIGSAESVGTATLSVGPVTITATGIASAEAFGSSLVSSAGGPQSMTPTGIASDEAFGTAAVSGGTVNIAATGIGTAEAFGTHTLSVGGVVIGNTGIASGEAFGTATLTPGAVAITGTGIASGEAIGAATVGRGAVNLAPTGISSAEAVGTASVGRGAVTITGTGIASGEAFGAATLTTGPVGITATGIASGEAIGTATVGRGAVTLSPTGIASAEAFGSDTVTPGAVTLAPTGIASGEAFGSASVSGKTFVAVTYSGVNSTAGATNGTTTTAGTASISPATPSGAFSGDRLFIFQSHSCATGSVTPAGVNELYKDVAIGTGTPGAGTGQRWASCYWIDYDGISTLPAFTLASAQQNSHAIMVVSVSKPLDGLWDLPTYSGVGSFFGAAGTAFSATTPAFNTSTLGFLLLHTTLNDSVTSSAPSLTPGGSMVVANTTERSDSGTTTGNDVRGVVHTADVTTGASAALTLAQTLSAASEGGFIAVMQTAYQAPAWPVLDNFTDTDGKRIQDHIGDSGHGWVPCNVGVGRFLVQSNAAWPDDAGEMICTCVPPTNDYEVEVDLYFTGSYVNLQQAAAASRVSFTATTLYVAGVWWSSSSGNFTLNLRRWVGGTFTDMNSVNPLTPAPASGSTHTVTLRIQGTSISVYYDGSLAIGPVTNSSIASGYAGIYSRDPVTATTGIHITRFQTRTYP